MLLIGKMCATKSCTLLLAMREPASDIDAYQPPTWLISTISSIKKIPHVLPEERMANHRG